MIYATRIDIGSGCAADEGGFIQSTTQNYDLIAIISRLLIPDVRLDAQLAQSHAASALYPLGPLPWGIGIIRC